MDDAPTVEALAFEYHWYPVMVPLPAVATTESAFAVIFWLYEAVAVDCEVIVGAALIVAITATREVATQVADVAST
jgi:hypothetical protein